MLRTAALVAGAIIHGSGSCAHSAGWEGPYSIQFEKEQRS